MSDAVETLARLVESLTRRIEELESQAAFQDELHEALNAAVSRQDREILAFKRQVQLLSERMKAFGEGDPETGPRDEKPPHY